MGQSTINLECFDIPIHTEPQGAEQAPLGYDDGFAAGCAATAAEQATTQTMLSEHVVQAMSENTFTYQEAQSNFLASIKPLLHQITEVILPAALLPTFHAQLNELLQGAAKLDAQGPIELRLPTDHIQSVTTLLNELEMSHIQIMVDDTLAHGACWVSTPTAETSLDIEAAFAVLKLHLCTLTETQEEVS